MAKRTVHICDWCGKEAVVEPDLIRSSRRFPDGWAHRNTRAPAASSAEGRPSLPELACDECMQVFNIMVTRLKEARRKARAGLPRRADASQDGYSVARVRRTKKRK